MPANRAALSLVPDEPDQVSRLERFRAEHPEVVILLRGPMPTAWVGQAKVERPTLRGLLDALEEIFPPDGGAGQREVRAACPPDHCGHRHRPVSRAAPGQAIPLTPFDVAV